MQKMLLVCLVAMMAMPWATARAETLNVCVWGDCPQGSYYTIQAALDDAVTGDTVMIWPLPPGEVWQGSGSETGYITDPGITIRGTSAEDVLVGPDAGEG